MLPEVAEGYGTETLHDLRREGDPETDDLIARLYAKDRITELNSVLKTLGEQRDLRGLAKLEQAVSSCTEGEAHDPMLEWIKHHSEPPERDEQLELAARLWNRDGASIALLLLTASLVNAYAAPVGAHTLMYAYRDQFDVKRRVGETGQFVFANFDPRGFWHPESTALPTILKVRLMHAAIRFLIQQFVLDTDGKPFSQSLVDLGFTTATEPREVPLSQEDQLGALMSFSWVVLDGLDRIGVKISDEEKEAYLHHWCVVGEKLGIRKDKLPSNVAKAAELTAEIRKDRIPDWDDPRPRPEDDEGVQLTKALIEMMQGETPGWFDPVVAAVLRRGVGHHLADKMRIPRDAFWDTVLDPPRLLGGLIRFATTTLGPIFGNPVEAVERRLLTEKLRGGEYYEPADYPIPTDFFEHWTRGGRKDKRMVSLWALHRFHRTEMQVRKSASLVDPRRPLRAGARVAGATLSRAGAAISRYRRFGP